MTLWTHELFSACGNSSAQIKYVHQSGTFPLDCVHFASNSYQLSTLMPMVFEACKVVRTLGLEWAE